LRDAEEADGERRGGVEDADIAGRRRDRDAQGDEGEHRPAGDPGQSQVHRREHHPRRGRREDPDDRAPDEDRERVGGRPDPAALQRRATTYTRTTSPARSRSTLFAMYPIMTAGTSPGGAERGGKR